MTQAFPELFPDPALANCVAVSADGWRVIAMDTHDTDASEGWSGDPQIQRSKLTIGMVRGEWSSPRSTANCNINANFFSILFH